MLISEIKDCVSSIIFKSEIKRVMWGICAYSRRNACPGTSLQDLLRLHRRKRFGWRKDLSRPFRYVLLSRKFLEQKIDVVVLGSL